MPVHDAGRVFHHWTETDEALARDAFFRPGNLELLEIGVVRRRGVLRQDACADPAARVYTLSVSLSVSDGSPNRIRTRLLGLRLR